MTASLRAPTRALFARARQTGLLRLALCLASLWLATLLGCPGGERPMLGSIERTTGTVSSTLRIAIPVINPSGTALR